MHSFQQFIQHTHLMLALQGQASIYVSPNIPYKKILGAQHYLPQQIQREQIHLLIDDTVFGSAKTGLCITEQGIYYKEDFEEVIFIRFDQIQHVATDFGILSQTLIVNHHIKLSFTQPDREGIRLLAEVLNQFIQAQQQSATSHTEHNSQQHPQASTVSPAIQSAMQLIMLIAAKNSSRIDEDQWEFIQQLSVYGDDVRDYIQSLKNNPVCVSKQQVMADLRHTQYDYDRELKAISFEFMLRLLVINNYAAQEIKTWMRDVEDALNIHPNDTDDIYAKVIQELKDIDQRERQQHQQDANQSQPSYPQLNIEQQQACELLGLSPKQLNHDTVKQAYRKKIAEFHPDQYQQLPASVRSLIEQQAQQLNQARDLLMAYLS